MNKRRLQTVIILQEVNGRTGTGVIFNLEQLILDLWKNLYERLAETFRCLLNALPVYLGGTNKTCYKQ
ncbi:unnamed protein product [Schistosoma curassoni]|nr:unnamed protein product [Schistosoma curassoni]CAH8608303.1 unnamed protein product [Schistosoma curassoni]